MFTNTNNKKTSIYFNHILKSMKGKKIIERLKGKCRAYGCEDAESVADKILFNLIIWITENQ